MNETAGDTGDEKAVLDLELNGVSERLCLGLEHTVQFLGLRDCTWEAVEDEAVYYLSVDSYRYITTSSRDTAVLRSWNLLTYPFLHSRLLSSSF